MEQNMDPNCFSCRLPVSSTVAAYGPLCGRADLHPHCAGAVWHEWCRRDWLAGLDTWTEIVTEATSPGTLRGGVDARRRYEAVGTIRAPFTDRQVAELNRYQVADIMHPFTCPSEQHPDDVVLLATSDGWHCPVRGCSFRQDWAHSFMADG